MADGARSVTVGPVIMAAREHGGFEALPGPSCRRGPRRVRSLARMPGEPPRAADLRLDRTRRGCAGQSLARRVQRLLAS